MSVHSVTVPAMIDKHTASQLRKAARQIEEATKTRDYWIGEAYGFGASLREVAEHAGITHVAVLKIVRKTRDAT